MSIYRIRRLEEGYNPRGRVILLCADAETSSVADEREITPERSQKVYNHSPDGFEFGYGGSGPAQLALAILLDFTNDELEARRYYQDFKWHFLATLPPGGVTASTYGIDIPAEEIEKWLTNNRPSPL